MVEGIYRTRLELEKVNAKTAGWSLMPLSYSLGPLEKAVARANVDIDPSEASRLNALSKDIREFIERTGTDPGAQVRGALTRVEKTLADGSARTTIGLSSGSTAP